jgi:hypothetical protein
MKLVNLIFVVLFPAALLAQEEGLYATLNGVQVRFGAKMEPPGSVVGELPGTITAPKHGVVHRLISDPPNRRQFGYDLRLDLLPDPQTVRLRIEPLTVLGVQQGWTQLAPSKYPVISPVRIGETVAFDLLVNPATGQKIVEYLTLRSRAFEDLRAAGPPRDFSPADLHLTIQNPRVWTNGKFEEVTAGNSASLAAHILWFFLPEGAFEISLWPEPALGFHKAGVVGAKTLTFHDGGSEYRVESSCQIVPADGLFNVYVLHDPDWGPGPGKAGFALGGADKPKQLSWRMSPDKK